MLHTSMVYNHLDIMANPGGNQEVVSEATVLRELESEGTRRVVELSCAEVVQLYSSL